MVQARLRETVGQVSAAVGRGVARFDPPETDFANDGADADDQGRPRRRPLLLSGWVLAAFIVAVPAPLLVLAALARTRSGLGGDPVAASGWMAAPLTFAVFLYFAAWRAPLELERFRQRGVLPDAAYSEAVAAMERRARNRLAVGFAVVLAGIVAYGYVVGLGDVGLFLREGLRNDGSGWEAAEFLELTLGPLLAALAALGFWRMAVLGWVVDRFSSTKLRIRLGHPDGCGGLEPLGRICVWNALILAVPGALLAFWLVAAYSGYEGTNMAVHGVLELTVFAVAVLALIVPLRRTHEQMQAAALPADAAKQAIAAEIDDLTEALLADPAPDPRERLRLAKRLRRERRVYASFESLPTWPIRSRDVVQFAVANVPTALGVLTSAAGLLRSAISMVERSPGS